jgi:hypothetical protein
VGPSHDSPQSQATILGPQQRPTPLRGWVRSRHVSRKGNMLQGINSGPDPHEECRTPGYTVRTPRVGPGPSDIQSGPPRFVPDLHVCELDPWNGIPPVWGPGPHRGSQGPRTVHTRAGVQYRHVSRPGLVRTCPRTLLLRAQAETRCCHVAYST